MGFEQSSSGLVISSYNSGEPWQDEERATIPRERTTCYKWSVDPSTRQEPERQRMPTHSEASWGEIDVQWREVGRTRKRDRERERESEKKTRKEREREREREREQKKKQKTHGENDRKKPKKTRQNPVTT